jgi:aldehyde:ferredoxin oxidoreductase
MSKSFLAAWRVLVRKALIIDLAKKSHRIASFDSATELVPLSSILALGLAQNKQREFLIFGRGVVAGHAGIGLATATITGYSPQSGGVVEAKVEGGLAKSLLSLEVEAVAVINRSPELLGLKIQKEVDYSVEFVEANEFAGLDIWQTTEKVMKDTGASWQIAAISQFGERGSKAASIVINNGFATSCGGLGATSGGLNLKFLAIAPGEAKSTTSINEVTDKYLAELKNNPLTLSEYQDGFSLWIAPGLAGYQAGGNFAGELPSSVEAFEANKIREKLVDFGSSACPGCGQSCLKSYSINSDNPIDGGRSHQLSIAAFVSQYGDSDMNRAIEFNETCHQLGIEHLYACQLLIDNNVSKSLPIYTALNEVADKEISDRKDLIKGMVIPPWDPRGSQGLGLAMALNPAGPRYDVIEHDIDFDPSWAWERHTEFGYEFGVPKGGIPLGTLGSERIDSLKELWLLWSGIDAVGVCMYASPPTRELRLSGILKMLSSVVGREINREDFFHIGRLRLALQREANYLFGLKDDGDDMPEKFFNEAITATVNSLAGVKINREQYKTAAAALFEEFDWVVGGSINANSALNRQIDSLKQSAINAIG